MYRLNEAGAVIARNEHKELEAAMLAAGVRSAALWDLSSIIEGYARHGVTITEREAELWYSVCGDALQAVAAAAGEKFAGDFILRDAARRIAEELAGNIQGRQLDDNGKTVVMVNECIAQNRIFSRQELADAYRAQGMEVTEADIDHWFDTYGYALQHIISRTGVPYSLNPETGKAEPLDA
jgi:hypothetical protein